MRDQSEIVGGVVRRYELSFTHHRRAGMRGYSLVEVLIVLAVMLVATAIGFMSIPPVVKEASVNQGYNTTISTMRRARDMAIAQRRTYVVTFTTPRTVTVAPVNPASDAINLSVTLPPDVSFSAVNGIPVVGPEGMGQGVATGAIDFNVNVGAGGSNKVYFFPDGSARDEVGRINDGVAYIARPGELRSSRALTLRGLTGRIRGWHIRMANGNAQWIQL